MTAQEIIEYCGGLCDEQIKRPLEYYCFKLGYNVITTLRKSGMYNPVKGVAPTFLGLRVEVDAVRPDTIELWENVTLREIGKPERPMGHWIRHLRNDLGEKLNDCIECSECHIWFSTDSMIRKSFCPNCEHNDSIYLCENCCYNYDSRYEIKRDSE